MYFHAFTNLRLLISLNKVVEYFYKYMLSFTGHDKFQEEFQSHQTDVSLVFIKVSELF